MNEKLNKALDQISDNHLNEAAQYKKKPRRIIWLGAIAAVLALVILFNGSGISLTLQAKAVSVADYPKYEWEYRGEEMDDAMGQLQDFFAAGMTRTLSGAAGENQAFSPINLYMALSLAAELTGGDSRQQILDLVGAGSIEALRAQASDIWNACYLDNQDQTLLANSLWLDEELEYSQRVMDTLADSYYTSVYQTDLSGSSANSAISAWLNKQTHNMLSKEAQHISLDPETVLALYSTIYFQAKWIDAVKFSEGSNTTGIFHAPAGDISRTFMNKQKMQSYYYWGESFGAVALGMKDGSRMWLILPDEGKTTADVLASEEYARLVLSGEKSENSKYLYVNLSLPKFDIQAASDLKGDLQSMGVTDIFVPGKADFSASVAADTPVTFTNVNQVTRVAIDEKGVTAASYIELPGAGAAEPPTEEIDFILDRPFLFVIANRYDIPLFAGVVNEP